MAVWSQTLTYEGAMPAFWNPNSLHYVIDWSAWATLVVGIAAVIGAFVIGLRQVGIAARQADITFRQAEIMDRQTDIAERQAETERTRLRAELYDRRVVVLTAIENYLSSMSTNRGVPPSDVSDRLYRSMSIAPFLLGEDAEILCRKLINTAAILRYATDLLDSRGSDSDEELIERVMNIYYEVDLLRSELRDLMNKYLNLKHADKLDYPPTA
jgi:hypothetical protein